MLLEAKPILDREKPTITPPVTKTLGIFLVGDDPASRTFVAMKEKQASLYGVATKIRSFPNSIDESTLLQAITECDNDALIVQLPLPPHIETDAVLAAIPDTKDVDDLTTRHQFVSPMVQAVNALAHEYNINLNQNICLVGYGRLVGQPIAAWLREQSIEPTIVDESTPDLDAAIRKADIVIGGSGAQHVINAANTRPGQIIFDCSGRDVDVAAIQATVAAVTPSKGGIGPLTVHYLFKNVQTI